MWLIKTDTFCLEFVNEAEDKQYAILSHTWGDDEVTFHDMSNIEIARTKTGFSKIEQTCKLASDRQIQHAWVDTCCIDKSSSAELAEAINSMFRWSWAAKRITSRPEDLSYCLFGLFDVNLPLIYGEGQKAFLRLQEAIAASNNDLSLFAWTSPDDLQDFRGVFARSPSEFGQCGGINRISYPFTPKPEYATTNKGLQINAELVKGKDDYLLDLQCIHQRSELSGNEYSSIVIGLRKTADGYVRHRFQAFLIIGPPGLIEVEKKAPICIPKNITPVESKLLKGRLDQCFAFRIENNSGYHVDVRARPEHLWDNLTKRFITDGHGMFTGLLDISTRRQRIVTSRSRRYHIRNFQEIWQHESSHLGIFGLRTLDAAEAVTYGANMGTLQPWAGIHDSHAPCSQLTKISRDTVTHILGQETEGGLPRVLAKLSVWLRATTFDNNVLPLASTTKPRWKPTEVFNTSQGNHLGHSSLSLSLIAQSTMTVGLYDLVLKVNEV